MPEEPDNFYEAGTFLELYRDLPQKQLLGHHKPEQLLACPVSTLHGFRKT